LTKTATFIEIMSFLFAKSFFYLEESSGYLNAL
jgi:hypothetical protein